MKDISDKSGMNKYWMKYKVIWITDSHPGYVVYRDRSTRKTTKEAYAKVHIVARFVEDYTANLFCDYMNKMTEKYNTDCVITISGGEFK